MQGNNKFINHLNRIWRSAIAVVQQYWIRCKLLENWDVDHLAEKSPTEINHANQLTERINFLEDHSNLQKLNLLRIGQKTREKLECDLAAPMKRAKTTAIRAAMRKQISLTPRWRTQKVTLTFWKSSLIFWQNRITELCPS